MVKNKDELKLTDLIDVSILQNMQDCFAKMARMAALTTDDSGSVITNATNFTDLCSKYCRASEEGRKRCEMCDRKGAIMSREQNKSVSYKCHANLVDFAAPIMLEDRMIGAFVGGQVLAEAPKEEEMRAVARELSLDEDEFWEAAQKVQIIPQIAIDRSTVFLYEFANIISDMAYSAYKEKELSDQAMQAAIQKQDFLANMSHEIRTPMNAVLGMAEMALREEMSEEAREYIEQIQASGKHLLVIINDILDFSKIDSGKMEIVDVVYRLDDVIEDVSNLVNSRIGEKKIEFIVDAPITLPEELYGDSIRIQQILINLLNNAVKFTKRGQVKLSIHAEEMDETTTKLIMQVSDTGQGIKAEDLGKLFGSFQQVDSKRNRNIEGTGLGLAICKQLVGLMGGSIRVESEYEVGSTFTVEVPQKVERKEVTVRKPEKPLRIYSYMKEGRVKQHILSILSDIDAGIMDISAENGTAELEDEAFLLIERSYKTEDMQYISDIIEQYKNIKVILIDEYDAPNDIKGDNITVLKKPIYCKQLYIALGLCEAAEKVDEEQGEFTFIAPDANVMIVDDNEINLKVAKGLLEPLKMNVDVANGANQCVELARSKSYDIIFMDHMMPEVDGVETTHILRRLVAGYEETPIIALTANAVGGVKEMFIREGMNDFVAKPIETKNIVAKVHHWLPAEKIIPLSEAERVLQRDISEVEILQIEQVTGLDVQKGISMLGSGKVYKQFMEDYYHDIDKKTEDIMNYYESMNYTDYTIAVHALKSASRQLGAEEIGNLAEQLEKAGKENNIEFIKQNTERLIHDYMLLKERLRPMFLHLEKEEQGEGNNLAACLDELEEALNTFDTLAIDDAFEHLSNVTMNSAGMQFMECIQKAYEDYDFDTCLEIIKEWREQ